MNKNFIDVLDKKEWELSTSVSWIYRYWKCYYKIYDSIFEDKIVKEMDIFKNNKHPWIPIKTSNEEYLRNIEIIYGIYKRLCSK